MSNIFSAVCTATRDSEVRVIPASGQEILTVSVANNQGFGDKQTTMFIRVSLWRKNAQNLADYIKKGTQIFVSGQLSMREYQASDGTTKTSVELNANTLDLFGGKREGAATQQSNVGAKAQAKPEYDNFDDIPFS